MNHFHVAGRNPASIARSFITHHSSFLSSGHRQKYRENRPFADFTLYLDSPSVPFHDGIGDGKSQAGPVAHTLGGEKRIEYILDRVGLHSYPSVLDIETDEVRVPGLHAYGYGPPVRHGLYGV